MRRPEFGEVVLDLLIASVIIGSVVYVAGLL